MSEIITYKGESYQVVDLYSDKGFLYQIDPGMMVLRKLPKQPPHKDGCICVSCEDKQPETFKTDAEWLKSMSSLTEDQAYEIILMVNAKIAEAMRKR